MASSIVIYYRAPLSGRRSPRVPIINVYDRYGLWVHNNHHPSITLREVDVIFSDLYSDFMQNAYKSVSELKRFLISCGFEDDSDTLRLLDPPAWSGTNCVFLQVDIVDP